MRKSFLLFTTVSTYKVFFRLTARKANLYKLAKTENHKIMAFSPTTLFFICFHHYLKSDLSQTKI